MNPFESTIESPLRFLSSYLKHHGEGYIRKQFELSKEHDFCYDETKGVIIVQKILPRNDLRGELLDEETNIREYELSWSEFVYDEFKRQLEISKRLINEQSKHNGKDQDAKLYSKILIDCLEVQKYLDSTLEINFETELNNFIRQIITYAFKKFNKYYSNIPEIKRVKSYYKDQNRLNVTGFKLKNQIDSSNIKAFLERLYSNKFVSKDTPQISIIQFLKGSIPPIPIDWIKDPHELKFFIDRLCYDIILEKKPKQKWKHLNKVFILDGNELDPNWHRNHNKLKNKDKRLEIVRLILRLYPNYIPKD
jgi:hypothetical protein